MIEPTLDEQIEWAELRVDVWSAIRCEDDADVLVLCAILATLKAEKERREAQSAQVWVVVSPKGKWLSACIYEKPAWDLAHISSFDVTRAKKLGYYAAPATLVWNRPEKEEG